MKPMYRKLLVVAAVALVCAILFNRFGVPRYLSLSYIQQMGIAFEKRVEQNYLLAVLSYILTCTFLTAAALPITGLCAMVGGFAFGIVRGLIYSVIAMTIGSVIYVILARYLLHNIIEGRYAQQLKKFNERIARYGHTYLISLHLLTVLPFFLINSLAALANVPLHTVAWTTAVGVIPGTLLYILAGKELAVMTSARDILKPHIIIFLVLLAGISLLPMLARHIEERMNK